MMAAFTAAALSWRNDPRRTLAATLHLGRIILIAAIIESLLGAPLIFFGPNRAWHLVHHYAGQLFIIGWNLYWPLLLFVSFARPRALWRKLLLGCTAIASAFLFLFVSFSGYLLPPRINTPTDERYAARFFLLHVKTVPPLAMIALIILLRQHWRATISATESRARD